MKFVYAPVLYFLIALTIVQNWVLVALLLSIMFSVQFGGVLLIPLAFLIDGYFGNFTGIPYLSIISIFWFLLVEYVRPKVAHLGEAEL